ncbi:MAG TPA: agmatine deiminase [Steroidobacteraceae bacterium]|jgi:agmatine deiminase|nr:agmatine deiminase [Steroidobacteraceae bacterium]
MRDRRLALRNFISTPAKDGFRMPAEFERHSGCWMLWPERSDNWRLGAKPAQAAFAAVATAIAGGEPVSVGVSAAQFANARARLPPDIRVVELTSNDAWMRDCGPTFVIDGKGRRRGVDWSFNAWGGLQGGLYFPWDRDDEVAQKVLEIEGADRYRTSLVMEGGAVHVDGQGTCLTTEECLLNPNRNPHLTREAIEDQLRRYLGVSHVIWLGRGVYRDETGGHIDELACFTSPGHVALTWTEDRSDPQFEISQDAYQRLRHAEDARGRRLEVHKIHQPGPLFMTAEEAAGIDARAGSHPRRAGDRLAASYINFYIANKCVVMPHYGERGDASAMRTLKRLFPGRAVLGVPTREILLGGGNIHCITQQVPRPVGARSGR